MSKRPPITQAKVTHTLKGVIDGGMPIERITRVVANTITGDITVITTPDLAPRLILNPRRRRHSCQVR
jgi:hypothetical protein